MSNANPLPFGDGARFAVLSQRLTVVGEDRAIALFRSGLDTVSIARELRCTPAAAANALARIRDRERQQ